MPLPRVAPRTWPAVPDRWLNRDFIGGGSAANQLKDLRFAADTAAAKGLRLPMSLALKEVFEQMIAEGLGDLDHSAVELAIAGAATSGGKTS